MQQVGWFEAFLRDQNKELEEASKNDLLEFLAHLRTKNYKQGSLGHLFAASLASMIFWKILEGFNPIPSLQSRNVTFVSTRLISTEMNVADCQRISANL